MQIFVDADAYPVVNIGSAPTGVETETRESVQKKMMYALHSPLKNLY